MKKKLITISGPTASGKTELSITLAYFFILSHLLSLSIAKYLPIIDDKTILEYAKILMSEFKMKLKIEYDYTFWVYKLKYKFIKKIWMDSKDIFKSRN